MGLEPIVQVFKADISDYKAKVRELKGEQKKLAEEQLKNLEEQNKKLDDHLKTYAKLAAGIGIVAGVAKFMWDDWKERAEKARLQTAAFGVDLTSLGNAALGTKSQMELLADAAKMNHGIFRLTSDQMAMVETAMIGLARRGHDMAEVQKKVLDAVTQLKTDGLSDLGIVVDKVGLSMDTAADRFKIFENTLAALNDVSKGVGKAQLTMSEEVEQAAARAANAWKKTKEEWFTGDAGFLMLTDKKYRDAAVRDVRQKLAASGASGNANFSADMDAAIGILQKNAQAAGAYATQYPVFGHELEMPEMNIGALRDQAKAVAKALADKRRELSDRVAKDLTDELILQLEEEAQSVAELVGTLDGGTSDGGYTFRGEDGGDLTNENSVQGRNQSRLEKIFGPVDEFDVYKAAFEGLTTVVQGSFDAWISGSMSAGEAFKRLAGDVLRAGAVQLLGEAIKHGAYAIGSLAFGDLRGAATHGTAAAKAAAGAAALGVLAKSIGGGGASSGGGGVGAAPTGSAASGGGGGGGPVERIVVFGQDYTMDTARQRGLRAERAFDAAKQAGSGGGVSHG